MIKHIPNVLTVFRLVLVPVFLVFLFIAPHDQLWRLGATLVFVVAVLTDLFDGQIARKYEVVSDFGKLWDPIADKAITGAAFIGLSILGELWWWVTILILIREWGITIMRVVMLKYQVMAAALGGKWKTMLQCIALTILLLYPLGLPFGPVIDWIIASVGWIIMGIALIFTVVTGGMYVRDALKLKREAAQPAEVAAEAEVAE
ncbi:MAG: CDP-diacylglycerol--glycerol-3-phosphate 3-phosphatidyltransferase [Propionibacteriaceae bacterium]|nr:CDP-diacylglycerol--glycerol-3-phosphate 3-phosphatidyltransferase [Propionibacteriaceae bacterium]